MGAAHCGQSVHPEETQVTKGDGQLSKLFQGHVLVVAAAPWAVKDGAEPEEAEDVGGVTA